MYTRRGGVCGRALSGGGGYQHAVFHLYVCVCAGGVLVRAKDQTGVVIFIWWLVDEKCLNMKWKPVVWHACIP